jgi:hypothetical protein
MTEGKSWTRSLRTQVQRIPTRIKRWIAYAVVVVAVILLAARPLVDTVIDNIYKNVAEPHDKELPVTVTSYSSGPQVVSIIGGKGEGLNCSLPPGIDLLFSPIESTSIRSSPVKQRFRQACVFHDLCYRHGLATYGYTQNDCDELLQEQAVRICVSVMQRANLSKCHLDAKKVVAGVKVGGFKFYQGWGSSTYFEFDSNPYRSMGFYAGRVVDQPFKMTLAAISRDVPDQMLVRFFVKRSQVTVNCLNCPNRQFSDEEFASAGVPNPTPDIKGSMRGERAVWLPAGKMASAPHLVSEGDGRQVFIWFMRENLESSSSCIVVTGTKHLLTHTRPRSAGCTKAASERLGLSQVDLLASSPQPAIVPLMASADAAIAGTGITAQQAGGLALCVSHNLRAGLLASEEPQRKCMELTGDNSSTLVGLERFGAFQNFPIIKGERQIYLSRSIGDGHNKDGAALGRAVVFDLKQEYLEPSFDAQAGLQLELSSSFRIPDDYDPMLPVSWDKEDLHLLSVRVPTNWWGVSRGNVEFYEINLRSDKPEPRQARTEFKSESAGIELHDSWARRPILVVADGKVADGKNTQLVLSRSAVTALPTQKATGVGPDQPRDEVRLEFAVLERQIKGENEAASYKLVRGLACTVKYTVLRPDSDAIQPCHRSITTAGGERATPATLLQGGQLLTGRFRERDQAELALFDSCVPNAPIYMQLLEIGAAPASSTPVLIDAAYTDETPPRLKRDVECLRISKLESLANKM